MVVKNDLISRGDGYFDSGLRNGPRCVVGYKIDNSINNAYTTPVARLAYRNKNIQKKKKNASVETIA